MIVSYSSDNVEYVNSNGNVNWNWYDNCKGVRPFWNGRRTKVRQEPKLESHYQKNKQPFLSRKRQDKYKGKNTMIKDKQTDFEKICDFQNLYNAYKRSKCGKGLQKVVLNFK